jgi:hypothetical protein
MWRRMYAAAVRCSFLLVGEIQAPQARREAWPTGFICRDDAVWPCLPAFLGHRTAVHDASPCCSEVQLGLRCHLGDPQRPRQAGRHGETASIHKDEALWPCLPAFLGHGRAVHDAPPCCRKVQVDGLCHLVVPVVVQASKETYLNPWSTRARCVEYACLFAWGAGGFHRMHTVRTPCCLVHPATHPSRP